MALPCLPAASRHFSYEVYRYAVAAARTLFTAGKYAMGMEDRDANWNLAMFGGVLVALVTVVILEVGL